MLETHFETLIFKIFWGSMSPDPPRRGKKNEKFFGPEPPGSRFNKVGRSEKSFVWVDGIFIIYGHCWLFPGA